LTSSASFFERFVHNSDITLVHRNKGRSSLGRLIQRKAQLGTRTEQGHRKPIIMTPCSAGRLVFDPKGDLHYRNCSDAGIFAPAVVSSFHTTREELTEGILS